MPMMAQNPSESKSVEIDHHQGAVRFLKIVLSYTKDPQIRQITRKIIAAQEKW